MNMQLHKSRSCSIYTLMVICVLLLLAGCDAKDYYECNGYSFENDDIWTRIMFRNLEGDEAVKAAAVRGDNLLAYTDSGKKVTLYCFSIQKMRLRWKRTMASCKVSLHPYVLIHENERIVNISDDGAEIAELKGNFKKVICGDYRSIGVIYNIIYLFYNDDFSAHEITKISDEYSDYDVSALMLEGRAVIVLHKIIDRTLKYKIIYYNKWYDVEWEASNELICSNSECEVMNEMRIEGEPWFWSKTTGYRTICPTINICNDEVVIAFGSQYSAFKVENGDTKGVKEIDKDMVIATMSSAGLMTFYVNNKCFIISRDGNKIIELPFDSRHYYYCDDCFVVGVYLDRGNPRAKTYNYRSGDSQERIYVSGYMHYVLITNEYAISVNSCSVEVQHRYRRSIFQ